MSEKIAFDMVRTLWVLHGELVAFDDKSKTCKLRVYHKNEHLIVEAKYVCNFRELTHRDANRFTVAQKDGDLIISGTYFTY